MYSISKYFQQLFRAYFMLPHCLWQFAIDMLRQVILPEAARSHEQVLNISIAWKSKNTVISSSSFMVLGKYY